MLTTKVVSNKKPPLLSDSESGGSTSQVGRVYRAKRPRVVHTLGGSYINDRQILSISPFEENIQYDSPKVGFGSKYPVISVEKFLKWADKDITDNLPPAEWEEYKRCKNGK